MHPHLFFEVLAYFVGFRVYLGLRRHFGDRIPNPLRWAVFAAAVGGAAIGSKVLFWLEDPRLAWQNLHNPIYFISGKTIVGALLGGLVAVETMKRTIGLKQSSGDLYAIPLALGIAIGRVGCFLTGLADNTYGTATTLPWAVDFGDGIRRHPTQLYEAIFLLLLIPMLVHVLRRIHTPTATFLPGDAFKVFMVSYLGFRFLCDFLKPYPSLFAGIGTIQWACLVGLLYYSRDIWRWFESTQADCTP